MKKVIFLLIFALLLATCNSVKKTQRAINEGNYERAISLAVENLKQNKVKKKNQPYVLMLEDAYKKANDRDLQRISFLKKENNAAQLETIYELFEKLKRRQQKIKPLLPLQIKDQNREANFKFVNYDNEIIATKKQLSDNLYQNARQLFDADNKFDYRTAYDDLAYLENINPNFKDVRNLMNIARDRGVDYVIVSMKNETEKVVPKRLEEDLLNFDTYGLDDLWTIYHGSKNNTITYDFSLELNLRNILVSPEKIREKELVKERQVKDGFTYLLDDNGNQVLDKDGKKIKIDKMVTVSCRLYQFTQFKTVKVTGQVKFLDLTTKQVVQTYPISSQFDFQHVYANYRGDKRALESSFLDLIELRAVPFPSNEQMIYDTGEDLKLRLKSIISRNKLRN